MPRGRPPRKDKRHSDKVRVNVTKEEMALIVKELTPDERRKALIDRIKENWAKIGALLHDPV